MGLNSTYIYTAKAEGICPICNTKYAIGARIAHNKATNSYGHATCVISNLNAGNEITRSPGAHAPVGPLNANPSFTRTPLYGVRQPAAVNKSFTKPADSRTANTRLGETMQTNEQTEYDGIECEMNALQQDLELQKKEAQKNSRFRQIESGKTARLKFTGRVFKRTSSGTDATTNTPYIAKKIDWELAETVQEGRDAGKNKLWSVGESNSINREILANLQKGIKEMLISREGTAKATKYKLSTLE